MSLLTTTLLAGLAGLAIDAPADNDTCSAGTALAAPAEKNIVETAVAAGSFNTLATALKAADLVDALQGEGPFTVFAPTDAAFAALPKGTLESLLERDNKATLQSILLYHVVDGNVPAKKVVKMAGAASLNGQRLGIDVSDEGVNVAGAMVTTTDIHCSNGVIHVIDAVMLPNTEDLVATAVGTGKFPTLTTALQAAGLVEALKGEGPFTVFAPTEEAFAALPDGTLESLLKPENRDKLTAILKLHVISGRVYSETAAKGAEVATLQGQKIRTRSDEHGVLVNGARVVSADIDTANGVIHVIDKVLLPE